MYEEDIKARLVDFLLRKSRGRQILLGSEVPFFNGKRRLDLIAVGNATNVFEIKSDADSFSRLPHQSRDYPKFFDYAYYVVSERRVQQLEKIIPPSAGVVIFRNAGELSILRKPVRRRDHSKENLLRILDRPTLDRMAKRLKVGVRHRTDIVTLRRTLAKTATRVECRKTLRNFLKGKLASRTKAFLRHRGKTTHPDDLKLLSNYVDAI